MRDRKDTCCMRKNAWEGRKEWEAEKANLTPSILLCKIKIKFRMYFLSCEDTVLWKKGACLMI